MMTTAIPFKLTKLQELPAPAIDSVCSLFTSYEQPHSNIDLWGAEQNTNKRVNTVRLYDHLFNRKKEKFTFELAMRIIAPLNNSLKKSVNEAYKEKISQFGIDAALVYLRKTIERLLVVWRKYPFHRIAGIEINKQNTFSNKSIIEDSVFSTFELLRTRKSKRFIKMAANAADNVLYVVQYAAQSTSDERYFEAYDAAALICKDWGIIPPYWNAVKRDRIQSAAECALLRMTSPKFWIQQLTRLRDQCCEHMNVAANLVNEQRPYISADSFNEWAEQQRSAMQWLENTMIENESDFFLPLIEAAMAGNANPKNRLVELIVRARGLEELAEEQGKIGLMVTITCPSKYHSNSYKWDHESANVAQKYLVGQFAKIRSALKYRDIHMTGMRVAEPHKDSTPHWHMLCFVRPEHEATLRTLLTKYAFEIDGDEDGAEEYRLDIKPIDKNEGSAVGYIIKYLSKNIAGEHMQGELDLESGLNIEDGSKCAAAWANRYRLRQFQFYGTSSVQVWRELRRIKVCPQPPEIEAARAAADSSNWYEFEQAMQNARLKLDYEITELGNEYGEATKKVTGLTGVNTSIVTRGECWKLRKATDDEKDALKTLQASRAAIFKAPENNNLNKKELNALMPKWSLSLLSFDFDLTRTCGNNCTDPVLTGVPERLLKHLQHIGIKHPIDIDRLINQGKRITSPDGFEWWLENGELRYNSCRYGEIIDRPLASLVAEMETRH